MSVLAAECFKIESVKDLLNAIYYLDSKYKVLSNGKPMFVDRTPIISLVFQSECVSDGKIKNYFMLSDYLNDPLRPGVELEEEDE